MLKKALLIDSLYSVEEIKKNKDKYKDIKICTIYTFIHLECKKNKINCFDLNTLIKNDYIKNEYNNIDNYIEFLSYLDHKNEINLNQGLPSINYFFSLFRYEALIDFVSLSIFIITLDEYININKINCLEIQCENKKSNVFFNNIDFFEYAQEHLKKKNFDVKVAILNENYSEPHYKKKNLQNLIRIFFLYISNFKFYLKNFFFKKKNNSLILDQTFNTLQIKDKENFLILKLKKNKLYKNDKSNLEIEEKINKIKKIDFKNSQQNFFKKKFCDHLSDNFVNYSTQINELNKIINKYNIKKAYWLYPPNTASINSLVVNFLLKEKIDVRGFQHGGSYGIFDNDDIVDKLHALSDYFFCKKFYSYGNISLAKDVKLYSKYKLCHFEKIGSPTIKNFIKKKFKKNSIMNKKILFPVNLTSNLLDLKYNDTSSDRLKLVKEIFLEIQNKSFEFIVKLYPNVSSKFIKEFYPVISILNEFKMFKKCELGLLESLNKHNPSLVIIDEMSTPLYEVLAFDCEIFCLENPLHNLKNDAYNKLEKRVHFIKDIKNFKKKLALFIEGKLEKKKNNSFLTSEVLDK